MGLGYKGDTQVKLLTVTKWLSGSASDSYVCMASYLCPGFEPIWGVTMRLASSPRNRSPNPLRALDSYTATKSLIYTCISLYAVTFISHKVIKLSTLLCT